MLMNGHRHLRSAKESLKLREDYKLKHFSGLIRFVSSMTHWRTSDKILSQCLMSIRTATLTTRL